MPEVSFYDVLTGLPTRTLVVDRLEHALRRARRNRTSVGVLCLNLEAPAAGGRAFTPPADWMLVAATERLKRSLRECDTVGRCGGAELIVVCEDLISSDQAMGLAERVQGSLSLPLEGEVETVALQVSVGVVFGPATSSALALLRDADAAMYHAHSKGQGCHAFFDATMGDDPGGHLEVETDLRRALVHGEGLRVSYQPEVDIQSGQVVGVEALGRWDHPALGPIGHESLAGLAQRSGLDGPLGRFILEEGCRQSAAWAAAGLNLRLRVSLSARHLVAPDLAGAVAEMLGRSGLAAGSLCLTVSEEALAGDDTTLATALWRLKSVGIAVGVTDFGSSFSSLAHLRRFPLDEVEVDRAFVALAGQDGETAAPLQAIVSAVHSLGLSAGAAGVERPEQLETLGRLGFQRARGRLFSPPVTPAEITGFVLARPGRVADIDLSTGRLGDRAG